MENQKENEIDLLCSKCSRPIEIISVAQKNCKNVEVSFSCSYCGSRKIKELYLYKK